MAIHGLVPSNKPTNPPHFDIEKVIRPNILSLQPYRCARDDYNDGILLDANENSHGHSLSSNSVGLCDQSVLDADLHRYPSPSHDDLKASVAELRGIGKDNIDHVFLGVGSDEIIDLLMRVCVRPGGEDKVLLTPPTYGMYSVTAHVNDVGIVKCNLELGPVGRFELRVDEMKKMIDTHPSIKLIFLCSPGNPTGTLIPLASIRSILTHPTFTGILAVDEAYVDFSPPGSSAVSLISEFDNIVVMQTLSKGFGLAGIRLGIAFSSPPLIRVLSNTKAPYNISTPTAMLALSALSPPSLASFRAKVDAILQQRVVLLNSLAELREAGLGVGVPLSQPHANFVLVPILARSNANDNKSGHGPDNVRAKAVYLALAEPATSDEERVVVRFRGNEVGCEACLRMTVGTERENEVLVRRLKEILEKM